MELFQPLEKVEPN